MDVLRPRVKTWKTSKKVTTHGGCIFLFLDGIQTILVPQGFKLAVIYRRQTSDSLKDAARSVRRVSTERERERDRRERERESQKREDQRREESEEGSKKIHVSETLAKWRNTAFFIAKVSGDNVVQDLDRSVARLRAGSHC